MLDIGISRLDIGRHGSETPMTVILTHEWQNGDLVITADPQNYVGSIVNLDWFEIIDGSEVGPISTGGDYTILGDDAEVVEVAGRDKKETYRFKVVVEDDAGQTAERTITIRPAVGNRYGRYLRAERYLRYA